jgi:hypothetical protein
MRLREDSSSPSCLKLPKKCNHQEKTALEREKETNQDEETEERLASMSELRQQIESGGPPRRIPQPGRR